MRKLFATLTAAALACGGFAQNVTKPAIPADPTVEQKIQKMLSKMSLDEKIGQMLELNIDIFGETDANGVWHINEQKLDTTISKYKIGSVLNAPATRAGTVKQWQTLPPSTNRCHSPWPWRTRWSSA